MGKKKPVNTKLVLIVSNWHFNRDHQQNREFKPCTVNDCTVQLKFSSTEFATEKSLGEPYHFDKHGVVFPYATFVALLRHVTFIHQFMIDVKDKYEQLEGPLTHVETVAPPPPPHRAVQVQIANDFADVEERDVDGAGIDDDDEIDDDFLPPPQKKTYKKAQSGKKTGK